MRMDVVLLIFFIKLFRIALSQCDSTHIGFVHLEDMDGKAYTNMFSAAAGVTESECDSHCKATTCWGFFFFSNSCYIYATDPTSASTQNVGGLVTYQYEASCDDGCDSTYAGFTHLDMDGQRYSGNYQQASGLSAAQCGSHCISEGQNCWGFFTSGSFCSIYTADPTGLSLQNSEEATNYKREARCDSIAACSNTPRLGFSLVVQRQGYDEPVETYITSLNECLMSCDLQGEDCWGILDRGSFCQLYSSDPTSNTVLDDVDMKVYEKCSDAAIAATPPSNPATCTHIWRTDALECDSTQYGVLFDDGTSLTHQLTSGPEPTTREECLAQCRQYLEHPSASALTPDEPASEINCCQWKQGVCEVYRSFETISSTGSTVAVFTCVEEELYCGDFGLTPTTISDCTERVMNNPSFPEGFSYLLVCSVSCIPTQTIYGCPDTAAFGLTPICASATLLGIPVNTPFVLEHNTDKRIMHACSSENGDIVTATRPASSNTYRLRMCNGTATTNFCSSYGDPHIINFEDAKRSPPQRSFDSYVAGEKLLFQFGDLEVIATQAERELSWGTVAVNEALQVKKTDSDGVTSIILSASIGGLMNVDSSEVIVTGLTSTSQDNWVSSVPPHWFENKFAFTGNLQVEVFLREKAKFGGHLEIGVFFLGSTEEDDISGLCAPTYSNAEPQLIPTSCSMLETCCGQYAASPIVYDVCLMDAEPDCCIEGATASCCEWVTPSCIDTPNFTCSDGECCGANGLCATCLEDGDCVGEWGAYGACTGDCEGNGEGTMTRTFSVSQSAAEGGIDCSNDDGDVFVKSCMLECSNWSFRETAGRTFSRPISENLRT